MKAIKVKSILPTGFLFLGFAGLQTAGAADSNTSNSSETNWRNSRLIVYCAEV